MENLQDITCVHCSKVFCLSINGGFTCLHCGFLNPLTCFAIDSINGVNYFNYLFLDVSLLIDLNLLEANFLILMQKYHPDKYATKTDLEQKNALQHTSYLNGAYNCLKSFMTTLAYYYKLKNSAEIITETDNTNSILAMDFLEVYEEMYALQNKDDKNKFIIKLQNQFNSLKTEIIDTNINDMVVVKSLFVKMRYLETIIKKAQQLNW